MRLREYQASERSSDRQDYQWIRDLTMRPNDEQFIEERIWEGTGTTKSLRSLNQQSSRVFSSTVDKDMMGKEEASMNSKETC
jgi:hypothetical protein